MNKTKFEWIDRYQTLTFTTMKRIIFALSIILSAVVTYAQDTLYTVGNFYEALGGYVFYLDETGQHGLVCTFFDQGEYAWGCRDKKIKGADGNELYSGKQNTLDIIKGCKDKMTAANVCDNWTVLGFDDWYLPSQYELELMCSNLHKNMAGNFAIDDYWSSTELNDESAKLYGFFATGSGGRGSAGKNYAFRVRAVRSF
jgi:hypothetical protein